MYVCMYDKNKVNNLSLKNCCLMEAARHTRVQERRG